MPAGLIVFAGEFAVRLGSESHRSWVVESGADRGSELGCPFVLKVLALRAHPATSMACEVRSDLLVDPEARSRHCAEVRDVIVCHAVRGWLRQTTRDPSNIECHECEEATSPGDARWHV
jgi:hypothetical protein